MHWEQTELSIVLGANRAFRRIRSTELVANRVFRRTAALVKFVAAAGWSNLSRSRDCGRSRFEPGLALACGTVYS